MCALVGGAALIEQDDDNQMPQSHILLKGENTQVIVEGAVLEASLKIANRYLVFMTDDIPNEHMLHAHLLDSERNLLEKTCAQQLFKGGRFTSARALDTKKNGVWRNALLWN